MVNKIIGYFKDLDKITYKIMKYGLVSCFILNIFSALMLFTYNLANASPNLFHIGLSLFKLSCSFGVEFIICGLVADSIKKQLV
ncbi:MAG: hypothetical protein IKF17_02460 [Clostridia bacterium]|nr:hypothetical protein [Clostridia bacterium]